MHGMHGVIQAHYGAPDHTAFDVFLETGMSNLFWQHELVEVVTVTEAAKKRFKEIVDTSSTQGLVLRLERTPQNNNPTEVLVNMCVGEPREDDQVVCHNGNPLIHISSQVSQSYEGCVIELTERPEGLSFSIGLPGAGRYAR